MADASHSLNGHGDAVERVTLRDAASSAIRHGRLPALSPTSYWGGEGCGERCSVCEAVIPPAEVELELVFADTESHHLHVRCFDAWVQARKQHALADERETGGDECHISPAPELLSAEKSDGKIARHERDDRP